MQMMQDLNTIITAGIFLMQSHSMQIIISKEMHQETSYMIIRTK